MLEAKKTARAIVHIGFDGTVVKQYLATDARKRFLNECRVLRYLEMRGCDFVPRLLEADEAKLQITTTNCGARVEHCDEQKIREIFAELEHYGVRHDDPFLRNITYRATDGRFCVIDFEFATILDADAASQSDTSWRRDPSQGIDLSRTTRQTLRWWGITDRGVFRPNNEDSFLTIAFDTTQFHYLGRVGEVSDTSLDFVFAISDGMGGQNSGEFASRFAVDNVTRLLPRRFQISPRHYEHAIPQFLGELLHGIHRQITSLGRSYPQGRNMGATLTLVWIVRGVLFYGHIGDSRLYHLPRAAALHQVTEDHTHVGWLRKQGHLNEREARMHPRKNVLSQSLGAGNQRISPQIGRIDCRTGDRFLLCTDGVMEGIWDSGLEEMLRNRQLADPAEAIVRMAVTESGRDNATAIVIEIGSGA